MGSCSYATWLRCNNLIAIECSYIRSCVLDVCEVKHLVSQLPLFFFKQVLNTDVYAENKNTGERLTAWVPAGPTEEEECREMNEKQKS